MPGSRDGNPVVRILLGPCGVMTQPHAVIPLDSKAVYGTPGNGVKEIADQ